MATSRTVTAANSASPNHLSPGWSRRFHRAVTASPSSAQPRVIHSLSSWSGMATLTKPRATAANQASALVRRGSSTGHSRRAR